MQGNYKWCEQLCGLTGKKVIGTQKLYAHSCKEQLKSTFCTYA
jgi:hypothetical protein